MLTESHLDEGVESLFNLSGYRRFTMNRSSFGGGIAAYVHFSLEFKINKDLTGVFASHEALFFTVTCPGRVDIDIFCIYRPPGKNLQPFVGYLNKINSRKFRRKCLVIGDINLCPVRDANTTGYRSLELFFHTKNFWQLVDYPTYFSYNAKPSTLDHIWSNLDFKSYCNVFKSAISDHIPVIICFDIETKLPDVEIKFRDFSIAKMKYFFENFESEFFEFYGDLLSNDSNLDERFEIVDAWLVKACNRFFPIKRKKVSHKRFLSPWLTNSLIKLIRKKHRLFTYYKRKKISYQSYSTYCKGLKVLLHLAESMYHRRRFDDLKFDVRKKWRHLNCLLGRGVLDDEINFLTVDGNKVDGANEIGNVFLDFFSTIASKLHRLLPKPDENFGLIIERNSNSLSDFIPVTEGEIIVILNDLKNNSATSDIPTKFIKLFPNLLAKLLCPLFNACLKECKYPLILKMANLRPIFKKGNKDKVENYRPISLLPIINKIFETLINDRLYNFFEQHNLISDNQFGYLRNRSTSQAVIKIIQHSLPAIENKNFCIVTMIDLKKAFDCVSHKLLIAKLERYGVRGRALSLMQSYLTARKQRIKIGEKCLSGFENVIEGVPQGSVLGPFLYLVYANDLNNIINDIKVVTFADDIALCLNGDDFQCLVRAMNSGLSILSNWARFNLLPISYEKCHSIVVTNRQFEIRDPLSIDGNPIPIFRTTVYLGIHIDDRLTFLPHINYVTDRLAHLCGISWKIKYRLNVNAAKTYFYSFVYSLLNYGIAAWGGALLNYNCTRLHTLYRRIILNLLGWHFPGVSYEQLCYNFKILSPIDIFKFNLLLLYFKVAKYGYLPRLEFETQVNVYSSRHGNGLKVPFPRTDVCKMHHQYLVPVLWNELPINIKMEPTLFKFRASLKKHLFDCYFQFHNLS